MPRRRIPAAGAGISFDAIPPGIGLPRKRPAQYAADCGAFLSRGSTHVELARRADLQHGGEVLERTVGAGLETDLRGRPRPAQRAARRPHRDGTLRLGAYAVASALIRKCKL